MRAQVDAKNAALEAARRAKMEALKLRNWLMGQAMVRNALAQSGLSQAEQSRVQAEARTKGVSAALGLLASLKQAAQARLAALEARITRIEERLDKAQQNSGSTKPSYPPRPLYPDPETADLTEAERLAEYRQSPTYQARQERYRQWEAQRAYQHYRQGEWADPQPAAQPASSNSSKPWWQRAGEWVQQKIVQPVQQAMPKVMNWVDHHQREIAIGVGIAAGVAAVVLSGGAATPLVAAAWVAGSAAVAGGVVAAGTMGINAYFHRPLTTNLWRNVGYAAGAAVVTATAGFLLSGGVIQQGLYTVGNTATRFCITHPAACARVGAVMTLWDKVEDIGLQAKLAIQTIQRDPRAAETALELQLERLDNTPGNTTFREIQESLSTLVGKYGDEVARLVRRFGNDGAELLAKYQEDAAELLQKGEHVAAHWTEYIPADYYDDVIDAFRERKAIAMKLNDDVTVYRYWGEGSAEIGNWLTTYPDLTPEQARALLALPNNNPATNITQTCHTKGHNHSSGRSGW